MADVKTQTWGYKFTRKIARRMPYFRGEPPARHGSEGVIIWHAEGPIAFDAPRIEYSSKYDRALEAYARARSAYGTKMILKRKKKHGLACGEHTYARLT